MAFFHYIISKIYLVQDLGLSMSEVDTTKNVYLFTHGRMDLNEKAISALETKGFSKENVICLLYTSDAADE